MDKVLAGYGLREGECSIKPFGSGLINHTWVLCSGDEQFILQKVNQNVFREPEAIAWNMGLIDTYLQDQNKDYFFVSPVKTVSGDTMLYIEDDGYYRMFPFVRGSHSIDVVEERKKDIRELAAFYLRSFAQKTNRKDLRISSAALRALEDYNWPGNIRELKNCIERSVILMQDDELQIADLPLEVQQYADQESVAGEHPSSLSAVEKNHIRRILQFTKGNKAEAARILEIGVATLYRKIDEYQL